MFHGRIDFVNCAKLKKTELFAIFFDEIRDYHEDRLVVGEDGILPCVVYRLSRECSHDHLFL